MKLLPIKAKRRQRMRASIFPGAEFEKALGAPREKPVFQRNYNVEKASFLAKHATMISSSQFHLLELEFNNNPEIKRILQEGGSASNTADRIARILQNREPNKQVGPTSGVANKQPPKINLPYNSIRAFADWIRWAHKLPRD